jgi:hypothetical protein
MNCKYKNHYILPLQNNFFSFMPQLITLILSLYLESRATSGISASSFIKLDIENKLCALRD